MRPSHPGSRFVALAHRQCHCPFFVEKKIVTTTPPRHFMESPEVSLHGELPQTTLKSRIQLHAPEKDQDGRL